MCDVYFGYMVGAIGFLHEVCGFNYIGYCFDFLGLQTQKQAMVWKDSETLWSQVLEIYPTCDLALGNRGNYRGKNGNIQGAMQDFEVAI